MRTSRREILRQLALLTGGLLVAGRAATPPAMPAESDKLGPVLPRRPFGRTGLNVTLLTVGGWHIGAMSAREAEEAIEAAIAAGVRSFDTAESYHGGGSEEFYGRFLSPKYREHVLILTKSTARSGEAARRHLEGSLRRLRTDYLDVWQMHTLQSPSDVDGRLKEGVLDVMLRAKADGKVRHIGFTGHRTWKAHAHLLKRTDAMESCLMPINIADPSYESYILNVLPTLVERGMAVQAMKTLGNGGLLSTRGRRGVVPARVPVREALRFAWSLPISTLVSGVDDAAMLRQNAAWAAEFQPLTEAERSALVERVSDLGRTGDLEWYKA